MQRADVYMVRFDPIEGSEQAGTRPAVIVSRDALNASRAHVVVVPFTSSTTRRILPSHVQVPAGEGGLTAPSVALTEHLRAVAKTRAVRQLGHLSPGSMRRLDVALSWCLGLTPAPEED